WKAMVYFVQSVKGGPIKIRFTVRLNGRLSGLKVEYKTEFRVLGVIDGGRDRETALHRMFSGIRSHKIDWFHPKPELLEWIKDHGQEWDGLDEKPTKMIPIDESVFARLRIVAAFKGIKVGKYVSEVMGRVVEEEISQQVDDYLRK